MRRLRAWWFHRQGLTPQAAPKTLDACIRRTGWLATAGGPGAYLIIHAVTATLADRFLRRHGPATLDEFVWWAGITKTEGRQALAGIGAEPIAVDGWMDEAWLAKDDASAWRSFTADVDEARVVLLPFRDPSACTITRSSRGRRWSACGNTTRNAKRW